MSSTRVPSAGNVQITIYKNPRRDIIVIVVPRFLPGRFSERFFFFLSKSSDFFKKTRHEIRLRRKGVGRGGERGSDLCVLAPRPVIGGGGGDDHDDLRRKSAKRGTATGAGGALRRSSSRVWLASSPTSAVRNAAAVFINSIIVIRIAYVCMYRVM